MSQTNAYSDKAGQLYQLLPAFYRVLDAKEGYPLKALLEVIGRQAGIIDEDISRLYRNWFIETCDEWVVPYIADLLGVRGLHPVSNATYSLRAFVANTIAYRRRKGTATMLEQLARDITGWDARAVEFFKLLGVTQHYNHIRPGSFRTPDLRRTDIMELLDTPFDTIGHTADVRHISSRRGKHNIPNIGIFLWRLQSYPIAEAEPCTVQAAGNGRYTFNPLCCDSLLFNLPQTELEITHLAEEQNVSCALRRRPLYDELEAHRQALADNRTPQYTWFDDRDGAEFPPVFEVFINGSSQAIPSRELLICNLEDWHLPPKVKMYKHRKSDGTTTDIPGNITAAVDPVLGRLTFAEPDKVTQVRVSYAYGSSGDVGGGPYEREFFLSENDAVLYKVSEDPNHFDSVKEAYDKWKTEASSENAILRIEDNRIYHEDLSIAVPAGKTLEIRAAVEKFPLLEITGNFQVTGGTGAKVILNGLRISSQPLTIGSGDLRSLAICHCTLVPGLELNADRSPKSPGQFSVSSTVVDENSDLEVSIQRSICGGIQLLDTHDLNIKDSIIQGLGIPAVDGSTLVVESSTILGAVSVRKIKEASNTIFTASVYSRLTQEGCVRFCYVPDDSRVPRRFRCQPDLAIKKALDAAIELQPTLSDTEKDLITTEIMGRVKPLFTSEIYGNPGYTQLHRNCPEEIFKGAEDGAEMGVWRHLQQPQRLANLQAGLEEYLPAAMEAGIFFIN